MKPLIKLNPITLQEQLYKELLNSIDSGDYKPGDKIRTEYELMEIYHVSRVTVRAAIQQLVNEGKLEKKPGKGTFVKQKAYTEFVIQGGSFTENCLQRHAKPSTFIVDSNIINCPDSSLKVIADTDNKLIKITRIRYVDSDPCIVEIDYFPTDFSFLLSEKGKSSSFIKSIVKKTGIIPDQFVDQFTIEHANKEYAAFLKCPIRTPLLKVTQTVNAQSSIVYINEQLILTSKYIYVKK